jgi:IS5 family transposase
VVQRARQDRIAAGRKLRTDTTVVESNIHYPQDSTLLQDGIRVLTRAVKRITGQCLPGTVDIVDHARAAQRRVLEIHRAARSLTDRGRGRLQEGYRRLVSLAHGVVGKAEQVVAQLASGEAPIVGEVLQVLAGEAQIRHYVPLVHRVLAQRQARVFGGDTHVPGKVLSLFEEHTQAIRKGKAHKPTEFGRLVRLDEVENGIVSGYEVQDGNPADTDAWEPALDPSFWGSA